MNTNLTQEQISALVDGELDGPQADALLALLARSKDRTDWEIYHQIGDALRSDEATPALSPDFSERLFARLDAEPVILAPIPIPQQTIVAASAPVTSTRSSSKNRLKRFAVPGMAAAAAVATVAFLTTPQLMVASRTTTPAVLAAVPSALTKAGLESAPVAVPVATVATLATEPEEVMLRDPRIDDYLFAHQRFSSSVYSTAQFARSATFATNSGK
jgi:sigma-E factor negative regulatory protein RseA